MVSCTLDWKMVDGSVSSFSSRFLPSLLIILSPWYMPSASFFHHSPLSLVLVPSYIIIFICHTVFLSNSTLALVSMRATHQHSLSLKHLPISQPLIPSMLLTGPHLDLICLQLHNPNLLAISAFLLIMLFRLLICWLPHILLFTSPSWATFLHTQFHSNLLLPSIVWLLWLFPIHVYKNSH